MAIVWWSAHKLTWDCTFIDDEQDASGEGLLQGMGLDSDTVERQVAIVQPGGASPLASSTGTAPAAAAPERGQDWYQRMVQRRRRPHTPGVWVMYYALAALPLFGVGQLADPRHRHGQPAACVSTDLRLRRLRPGSVADHQLPGPAPLFAAAQSADARRHGRHVAGTRRRDDRRGAARCVLPAASRRIVEHFAAPVRIRFAQQTCAPIAMPWATMGRNDPQRLHARAPTRSRNLRPLRLRPGRNKANRPAGRPANQPRHHHPIHHPQQATRSPGHRPQRVTRSPIHPLQAVTQSPNHRSVRATHLPNNDPQHEGKSAPQPSQGQPGDSGTKDNQPPSDSPPNNDRRGPEARPSQEGKPRAKDSRTVHRKKRNSRPNSQANRTRLTVETRRKTASRPTRNLARAKVNRNPAQHTAEQPQASPQPSKSSRPPSSWSPARVLEKVAGSLGNLLKLILLAALVCAAVILCVEIPRHHRSGACATVAGHPAAAGQPLGWSPPASRWRRSESGLAALRSSFAVLCQLHRSVPERRRRTIDDRAVDSVQLRGPGSMGARTRLRAQRRPDAARVCPRIARRYDDVGAETQMLAELYCRVAYGHERIVPQRRDHLRRLWQQLRATPPARNLVPQVPIDST